MFFFTKTQFCWILKLKKKRNVSTTILIKVSKILPSFKLNTMVEKRYKRPADAMYWQTQRM